ncbi:MAG: Ig-like domain-containing protein [Verrucomicrobia bacterium]|nr:Ig-like domain-containing protein [Verrucomicrobiota bacterium]
MKFICALALFAGVVVRGFAITATAFSPANNATNRCPDTLLTLTFDAVPRLGTAGRVRILNSATDAVVETIDLASATPTRLIGTNTTPYNYLPIIIAGQTATIFPRAGVLAYGQTYYVLIDAGVFADFAGIADQTAFRFTTRAAGPAVGATALTVAGDGSGDFCTVQGAIDFVPRNNPARTTITVKRGTYQEIVYLGSAKPFITLRGEDRAATVITYANNANFNSGNNRTMVACDAADFVLENITLRNATPKGGSQAEAIRGNGQRCVFDRVTLSSYQDTLLWNGSLFVTDSLIEGDVDFMWGGGACFFQRCELRALSNGYYAQVRNSQTGKGNVYVDCRLTAAAGVTSSVLARIDPRAGVANTWPFSQVVFLNCAMGPHITAAGWQLDGGATTAPDLQFWEFKSTDLNGAPLDVTRRLSSSRQLDDATAAQYRSPQFVLGFTPQLSAPTPAPRPERLTGLSTRARATGGDGAVIVGFVVSGTTAKSVLARAIGPGLAAFGVGDVLTAPRLELFRAGAQSAFENNVGWTTAPNAAAIAAANQQAGVFSLASTSADSALVTSLAPGGYTVVMSDTAGRAGNGLVEIYDLTKDNPAQRLANLSSRAFVGTGDATLIAGMTISGEVAKPVLVRAIGPTLAVFGVGGALVQPVLTVFGDKGGVVAQNANWTAASNALEIARVAAQVGAFPLTTGSGDNAILLSLEPGNYTAQVTGVGGATGVALLEVYEVP